MHSIQKTSAQTLKLELIFKNAEKGNFFSYDDLQNLAGVVMNERGKSFMRSALRRLKLPYVTIKGKGIEILSSKNATHIVVNKVVKIDAAVKKAEKITTWVRAKVYDEITEPEQKNLNFLGVWFGTLRAYSQAAKQIFKPTSIDNY